MVMFVSCVIESTQCQVVAGRVRQLAQGSGAVEQLLIATLHTTYCDACYPIWVKMAPKKKKKKYYQVTPRCVTIATRCAVTSFSCVANNDQFT